MARILYCRHDDCGKPHEVDAGYFPPICPACKRCAAWATHPGVAPILAGGLVLTVNDRRFLKSLRIGAD